MMNGTVDVDSKLGEGTTFTIILKQVEVAATEVENYETPKIETDNVYFGKAKILVCDDVNYNRELIMAYLENRDFDVHQAVNGEDALKKTSQVKPDITLLDMKMPIMDGYEVSSILKQDAELKNIPIIAVTASALKADEEIISSLCDGYLRKPISMSELTKELMRFIPYNLGVDEDDAGKNFSENETLLDSVSTEELANVPQFLIDEIFNAASKEDVASLESIIDELDIYSFSLAIRIKKLLRDKNFKSIIENCLIIND